MVYDNPPKILVVLPTFRVGNGVVAHVMNYYGEISKHFDVDFATYTEIKNKYTNTVLKKGGNIFYFEKSFLKSHKAIKEFFKEHASEYDIIHCHVLNYGLLYLYYAKKYGIRQRILHVHNSRYSDNMIKSFITSFIARMCVRLANVYAACSRQSGKKVYHNRPFTVISNGIDLLKFANGNRERVRTELNVDESTILFGNVGRLAKQKNQTFAIRILAELKNMERFAKSKSKLVIIGKGPDYENLVRLAKDFGLSNDVFFIENSDNIEDYYAAMDCFIFPSLYEGLGMAMIEAQASGLPCFCFDILPEEVFASDLVHIMKSKSNGKQWVEEIAKVVFTRKNVIKNLQDSGFDVRREKDKLICFYDGLCKEAE